MERVDFDHYLKNGNDKRIIGSGVYFRNGRRKYFRMRTEFPKKYRGKVRKIKKTRIRIKRRLKYLNQ